jgi:hypothetical protein
LTPDDDLEQHVRIMHGLPEADPTTARQKELTAPPSPSQPPVEAETEQEEDASDD